MTGKVLSKCDIGFWRVKTFSPEKYLKVEV